MNYKKTRAYIFLADGFEEVEALAPVDLLRRADCEVITTAVGETKTITGSHNIPVVCDLAQTELDLANLDCDMIILPGGAAGVEKLYNSPVVISAVKQCTQRGIRIAAICAAPSILGKLGLAQGVRMTCYPGWEKHLTGYIPTDCDVITDGIYTTAKGAGRSIEFALELVSSLYGREKASEVAAAIQYS